MHSLFDWFDRSPNSGQLISGMEVFEEAMASNIYDGRLDESRHVVVKSKRPRRKMVNHTIVSSATSSSEFSGITSTEEEEEEDMANCLILLSQGRALDASTINGEDDQKSAGFSLPKETASNGNSSFWSYKCRTCSKSFPSHQALGGHRTSHKRPKTAPMEAPMVVVDGREKAALKVDYSKISGNNNTPFSSSDHNYNQNATAIPAVSSTTFGTAAKLRVHDCTICGLEFSSGQALGGHMRRHRSMPIPYASSSQEDKKEKILFSLDLNLPACSI